MGLEGQCVGIAPPFLSPQNANLDPVDFHLDSKGSLNSLLGLRI